eukprot:6179116-Prymnesium_polylepis.1
MQVVSRTHARVGRRACCENQQRPKSRSGGAARCICASCCLTWTQFHAVYVSRKSGSRRARCEQPSGWRSTSGGGSEARRAAWGEERA